MSLPGSQSAAALSARRATTETPVNAQTPRRPGVFVWSRRCGLPTVVSINAWARPRKPSASSRVAAAAAHVRPAWEAPSEDQDFAREEREGRQAGKHAEGHPHRRSQDGLGCGRCP